MINAAHPLAAALAGMGALALVPAAVAARTGSGHAPIFLATFAFAFFVAGLLRFTMQDRPVRLTRTGGVALVAAIWLLVPLAATPSIAIAAGLPPLAAWFEAVSAFTATGLTALKQGPASLFVWFGLLQWAGGLFTVVSAVAVLAPAGLGGLPDRTPRGGAALDVVDLVAVLRETAPAYVAATGLIVVLLLMGGESFYVAFTLATAVVSAGAHLPPEAQLALTLDESPKWLLLPFLLWSATSVRWHRALLTRRVNAAPEQVESLVIIGWWAVLGVVVGAILYRTADAPSLEALRDGLFSAASLISTSGIGPRDGSYESLPAGLVILVVLLGGGALSVAGGLKMMRLRAILLRTRGDLMRLVYPHLVQPAALEGGVGSVMRGIWAGAASLAFLFGVCAIALSPGLPSFQAALAAAAAVVTNTGPVYDAAGLGWPAISSLPVGSVLVAVLGMVAGRLEIIGLFVVLHLAVWRT
ncbi:TrkH family potassium uptake protein [Xanthobacter dioxanivorans]|uniref:TrkH family potassium uptake protein n=1 Tax=Xanthobacter dioxanivorans TaxID=2528964 RepID=A0A974PLN9_9HYPH|nr:TrkH family potassium uptake protein [Xanthobacter dioxanivorans]QRG05476.1 TrkH family potassium uptake protein [Xanthobacter dioxanivorans]